jgi:hypothetical protein
MERQMSNSSYDGTGTNILTGAVIFSTFFLLVAILASTGSILGGGNVPAAKTPVNETVVVTAPPAGNNS